MQVQKIKKKQAQNHPLPRPILLWKAWWSCEHTDVDVNACILAHKMCVSVRAQGNLTSALSSASNEKEKGNVFKNVIHLKSFPHTEYIKLYMKVKSNIKQMNSI